MWVIRAGQDSLHFDKYIRAARVFIPWDGYKMDLSKVNSRAEYRGVVEKEKGTDNRTSVSNWAGQLYSFVHEIEIGDYVLIPTKGSRSYYLARITGDYNFDPTDQDGLYHSREVELLERDIPRGIFSQAIVYSLGAFRTLFKAKHESEILTTIKKWRAAQK